MDVIKNGGLCTICCKPRPRGCTTCCSSECQEASYRQNLERNKRKKKGAR